MRPVGHLDAQALDDSELIALGLATAASSHVEVDGADPYRANPGALGVAAATWAYP